MILDVFNMLGFLNVVCSQIIVAIEEMNGADTMHLLGNSLVNQCDDGNNALCLQASSIPMAVESSKGPVRLVALLSFTESRLAAQHSYHT